MILARPYIAAAAIAAAVLLAPVSTGVSFEGTDSTPATCDERSAAKHLKQARGITNAGYQRSNWRNGPKKAQVRRIGDHLRCLERRKDRSKVRAYVAKKRSALRLYREYRQVATVPCAAKGAFYPQDRWWSKPCYVLACESGFSWGAANASSSARGPYQMLDTWDRPWPVRSLRDKLRHHISASKLGLSHWVCA